MSDTPDDEGYGTVEENLGGPMRMPEEAELSTAGEYSMPRPGPRSEVHLRAENVEPMGAAASDE